MNNYYIRRLRLVVVVQSALPLVKPGWQTPQHRRFMSVHKIYIHTTVLGREAIDIFYMSAPGWVVGGGYTEFCPSMFCK